MTASDEVSSTNLTATGTVTVAAAAIGSIQFVSATPASIGLKGTGLNETSTVVFKVVDSSGGARPGVTVNFSLNTTAGGLSLAPSTATSGSDGSVQTVVSAGTEHTVVRVTATITSRAAQHAVECAQRHHRIARVRRLLDVGRSAELHHARVPERGSLWH